MPAALWVHATDSIGTLVGFGKSETMLATLDSVPSARKGYARGGLFIDRVDGVVYYNAGTYDSCVMGRLTPTETYATALGVVMDDPTAAAANVTVINAYLQTLKSPSSVKLPDLVINGRMYVNAQLVVPPKTNIRIRGAYGSGLSYRVGDDNYVYPGQGGPECMVVSTAGSGACIFLCQGVGTEIDHLKLQGRLIPTDDASATGTKISYGIRVEGNDYPPTGKNHFHDLTFVEVGSCFYYPASPDAAHGDTTDYGKMVMQGCDKIMLNENEQSIGHNFYGLVEFAGDGVSGSQIGFDMYDGGDINVQHMHWGCHGGTVLKVRSGSYGPYCNSYKIHLRAELASIGSPCNFCMFDGTAGDDLPYHVRFSGSLAGLPGTDYTASNLFNFVTSPVYQDKDISQDVQVNYVGADAAARNTNRATFSEFNTYRSPNTAWNQNE